MYRPLDEVANKYVSNNGKYSRRETTGEYYAETNLGNEQLVQSVGTPKDFTLNDLNIVEDIDIKFIVKIESQYYTSQTLFDNLQEAQTNSNPFFNLDYVTVIEINKQRLETRMTNNREKEKRAGQGVTVKSTLQSDEDIIRQIFWTVTSRTGEDEDRSYATESSEWTVNRLSDSVTFDFDKSVEVDEEHLEGDINVDDSDDETDDEDTDDTNGDDETTDSDNDTNTPTGPGNAQPRRGGQLGRIVDAITERTTPNLL